MVKREKLIDCLRNLELELRKSGKNETANFFEKAATTVGNESDSDILREFLRQLCSSRAMTQYANFSIAEEQLFDQCYEEAKSILILM